MDLDILEIVWNELQTQIDSLRSDVNGLLARSERAETAGGVAAVDTLADAPLSADGGVGDGDLLFIRSGRKTGEGAGNGSGICAYYNSADDSWRRFYDDAAVTE